MDTTHTIEITKSNLLRCGTTLENYNPKFFFEDSRSHLRRQEACMTSNTGFLISQDSGPTGCGIHATSFHVIAGQLRIWYGFVAQVTSSNFCEQ